jgi:hypothetical protein
LGVLEREIEQLALPARHDRHFAQRVARRNRRQGQGAGRPARDGDMMSLYPQPVRRQPSVEYIPADRAPVGGIEGKHDVASAEVAQRDSLVGGRIQKKVRACFPASGAMVFS